jgi:hypothetical protein
VADPRLLVSLPVAGQPLVILDQVENLRAFLPADTQIVLRLAPAMGVAPIDVAWMLPAGVHVHPLASETSDPHGDTVRWALDALAPFDRVVLHGSDDVYFRPGAAERIARAELGLTAVALPPDDAAHDDPAFAALLAELDAGEVLTGPLAGAFFATELFTTMLERVDRHLRPEASGPAWRPEVVYPTLASRLAGGVRTDPIAYSGSLAVDSAIDGAADDGFFAVTGVPRDLHDPLRTTLRARARATGARLRLTPPFEANDFVVLAFAADVLADPSVLATWIAAFGPEDTATLAIQVDASDGPSIDHLFTAITAAGGDAPDAPDIKLITAPPGSFAEAAQRWSLDALLRSAGQPAPTFLDDTPLVRPGSPTPLTAIAAARGIASSRT